MIIIAGGKKLKKEVVQRIKNGQLSPHELMEVYAQVKSVHGNAKKGLLVAAIMLGAICVLMFALSIQQILQNPSLMLPTYLATMGILVLILFVVKLTHVDPIKRQFVRAVKAGSPQMLQTLYDDGFIKP